MHNLRLLLKTSAGDGRLRGYLSEVWCPRTTPRLLTANPGSALQHIHVIVTSTYNFFFLIHFHFN